MTGSLRILLANVIDYAGTFPPASLDLATAIKNYATYQQGEWSWMLGRFVVRATQVGDLPTKKQGPITVVAGSDLASDIERVRALAVESMETKVASVAELERARKLIPASLMTYFEIPVTGDLLAAVAKAGARAKVRTGGEAVPAAADLARFIGRCAAAGVPFKATAGLHQPLRTEHHGFLNVSLAAAFALNGAKTQTLVELLEERSVPAFSFDEDGVTWRGQRLSNAQLRQARQRGFVAFGSCSFEEPIAGLEAMRIERATRQ